MTQPDLTPSGLASALRRSNRSANSAPLVGLRAARADMEGCAIYLTAFLGPRAVAEELYRLADYFSCVKDPSP